MEEELKIKLKREKLNNYSKDYMNKVRHPEIKMKKKALREYISTHGHLPGVKIKNKSRIEGSPRYPVNFPKEEFNKRLENILKQNPSEIEEKKLKDIIIWDILDKKGKLNPGGIVYLFVSPNWEYAIENTMNERKYVCIEREGERIYKKEE